MRTPPEPFGLRQGRLELDGLDLETLTSSLEGRAVWLLSEAALARVADRAAAAPGCVELGAVGPAPVLTHLARAGWWARVYSGHELEAATASGFPPGRLVACGAVKDDGFIKDAVVLGVAALETRDEHDRANVARIAAGLGRPVPDGMSGPPRRALEDPAGCGGLLARVLRPAPRLGVDAAWDPRWGGDPAEIWPLRPGPVAHTGTLEGLSRSGGPHPGPARIHGVVARGEWVVIVGPGVVLRRAPDPAHGDVATLLVGSGGWREAPSRPWPRGASAVGP